MRRRTLTRKVIIREYDYNKVREQALASADGITLYDRTSFTPLNQDNLEKLKLAEILKGKTGPITEVSWNLAIPAIFLFQLRDYLYNDKYYNWLVTVDEEGYICVQSRKNTPKTRIGWGVFEKDLECRI